MKNFKFVIFASLCLAPLPSLAEGIQSVHCAHEFDYFGGFLVDGVSQGSAGLTLTFSREAGIDGDGITVNSRTEVAALQSTDGTTQVYNLKEGTFTLNLSTRKGSISVEGLASESLNCSYETAAKLAL